MLDEYKRKLIRDVCVTCPIILEQMQEIYGLESYDVHRSGELDIYYKNIFEYVDTALHNMGILTIDSVNMFADYDCQRIAVRLLGLPELIMRKTQADPTYGEMIENCIDQSNLQPDLLLVDVVEKSALGSPLSNYWEILVGGIDMFINDDIFSKLCTSLVSTSNNSSSDALLNQTSVLLALSNHTKKLAFVADVLSIEYDCVELIESIPAYDRDLATLDPILLSRYLLVDGYFLDTGYRVKDTEIINHKITTPHHIEAYEHGTFDVTNSKLVMIAAEYCAGTDNLSETIEIITRLATAANFQPSAIEKCIEISRFFWDNKDGE